MGTGENLGDRAWQMQSNKNIRGVGADVYLSYAEYTYWN